MLFSRICFASGKISFEEVGPAYPVEEIMLHPVLEPVRGEGVVRGIFEINDPNFGNLWTNIPLEIFQQCGFEYGDFPRLIVRHNGEVVFDEHYSGNPLVNAIQINHDNSTEPGKREVAGYSFLEAKNKDEALKLLKDHPHITWNDTCTIEPLEVAPM